MKTILTIAIASLLSTAAFASGEHNAPSSGQWSAQSLDVTFGIGSAAASGGAAGSSVTGTAEHCAEVSASQTSLATGTSVASTTIGFGVTGGLTGTTGMDNTGEKSAFTESEGLTVGLGGAYGITSTSIAGHTDNTGAAGEAEVDGNGKATFGGGAYSESLALSGNALVVKYELDSKSFKVEQPKKEEHHDDEDHDDED